MAPCTTFMTGSQAQTINFKDSNSNQSIIELEYNQTVKS